MAAAILKLVWGFCIFACMIVLCLLLEYCISGRVCCKKELPLWERKSGRPPTYQEAVENDPELPKYSDLILM